MITLIRSAEIRYGALQEAFQWAVKSANYIRENFGTDVSVQRNIGGLLYEVHWVMQFNNLTELQELRDELDTDDGYLELLDIAHQEELFIGTGIIDQIQEEVGIELEEEEEDDDEFEEGDFEEDEQTIEIDIK